ncbi:GNAT family N-acetyltransferase [Lactobacillus sp. DCY120]|uniref:GNAT family N-acetyltransferase n=1 Tax=Bombilactobacillus apium TaxID=2675299 RepID=A0A850QYN3_9LACO|nr:GNAT family N-acetyltransferase [Bombilactobacillus apium]NVY95793.1 GNAT family N-acetyltransferase [Bombilactobacillus apium]
MWQIQTFSELDQIDLYQILALRTATFVVDQKRIYQEVDGQDLKAIHVFNRSPARQIAAYARVFLSDQGTKVTFGRVVTAPEFRGQGLGAKLMELVLTTIAQRFPGIPIEIEAQIQVVPFYEKYNFTKIGEPFIFQQTPHVRMGHLAL